MERTDHLKERGELVGFAFFSFYQKKKKKKKKKKKNTLGRFYEIKIVPKL